MDRYLGLDIGKKTLGVAISDPLKIIAQPIKVLTYEFEDQENLINLILQLLKDYQVSKIICGVPKNMDNSLSNTTKYVLKVINKLKKEVLIPVIEIDERLTSKSATKILVQGNFKKSNRKKLNDQIAASLILQTYLDSLNG